ncbi:MAG: hypothetical protein K2O28_03845 [Clostridia bacterium]|nr:hypothetical protein [Clostridia bacterium]
MKKKLIATLIASAVLSTGIIGLTACNNGDNGGEENIPDTVVAGVQVDKEGWAKAFETTLAAKSYTIKAYMESTYKAKGTLEEIGEIDLSVTETRTGLAYYDGNTYGTTKVKTVATGVPDDERYQKKYKNSEYEFEDYIVKDGDVYYSAYYSTKEENAEWTVETIDSIGGSAINVLGTDYATEAKGTTSTLDKLYDSFTYEEGVYNATLWQYDSEVKVSVSVKDGYVVGYSTDGLYEEEDEDGKESEEYKLVYNFSNFGSTTVTPSDAAKKAVEDYKTANAPKEPADSAVAGKTFAYDSIVFEYGANVSEEQIKQMEAMKPEMEAGYNGSTIIFNNNGGFTMPQTVQEQDYTVAGTYTENDNVITLTPVTMGGEPMQGSATPQSFTLSENKLTTSVNYGNGVTVKLIYVVQA